MTKSVDPIIIGFIGCGVVGQGVLRVLQSNRLSIQHRINRPIIVKTICVRTPKTYQDLDVIPSHTVVTNQPDDVLTDPDIQVVVEVMGGDMPAYEYIKTAIRHKKHIITANKELIAKHQSALFSLANEYGVGLFFEASVGGSVPIIRSLKTAYNANNIHSIYGILNGTTNYILTKLLEDQKDMATVIKDAQSLGFAESDPTSDISGLDAAYKIVILTGVALKKHIQIEDVYYEGIDALQLTDIQQLHQAGFCVRLIAKATQVDDDVVVMVAPLAIPLTHTLAMVRNEYNAVVVVGDMSGDAMIYGKGAGALPTGSAIVSDLMDIALDHTLISSSRYTQRPLDTVSVVPIHQHVTSFYWRIQGHDDDVMTIVTRVCRDVGVDILSITPLASSSECVVFTHAITESRYHDVRRALLDDPRIVSMPATIRVGL